MSDGPDETVPKERVRLEKNVVTEHQPVEADIRKEHIEVEEGRRHEAEALTPVPTSRAASLQVAGVAGS